MAPTDNYDVEIFDQAGLDVLEGLGVNRDTFVAERVLLVYSGTSLHPYVDDSDTLTLKIRGNQVPSAVLVVDLYFALGA